MRPEANRALGVEALELLAIGPLPDTAAELALRLSCEVHLPCRLAHGEVAVPPLLGRDGQGDADALLATLEARAAPGAVLVGLTAQDLALPIFTFVFGRARQAGAAAVVSVARLDPVFYGLPPRPELRLRRTLDEVRHELGHAAGLVHCADRSCLMSFAGSVEKVDARGSAFCADCAGTLPAWLAAPAAGP
jgi:archaemetzincin